MISTLSWSTLPFYLSLLPLVCLQLSLSFTIPRSLFIYLFSLSDTHSRSWSWSSFSFPLFSIVLFLSFSPPHLSHLLSPTLSSVLDFSHLSPISLPLSPRWIMNLSSSIFISLVPRSCSLLFIPFFPTVSFLLHHPSSPPSSLSHSTFSPSLIKKPSKKQLQKILAHDMNILWPSFMCSIVCYALLIATGQMCERHEWMINIKFSYYTTTVSWKWEVPSW
jgi:hypothetical protein